MPRVTVKGRLTDVEPELLAGLVARGLTYKEIGDELGGVSTSSVKYHLQCLRKAWGAGSRAEVVATAYQRGLLERDPAPWPEAPHKRLTPSQFRVLMMLAASQSYRSIAKELKIGENTVRTHILRMLHRLGARNSAHAVKRAVDTGQLPLVKRGFGMAEEVRLVGRCRGIGCGLPLTDPVSVRRGYGPTCWKNLHPSVRIAARRSALRAQRRNGTPLDGQTALFELDDEEQQ